jgi:hypothetical protein
MLAAKEFRSNHFVFPVATPPGGEARRIVGTWRLMRTELPPENRALRGESPIGIINYDANGYMAVQIAPDRARKRFGYSPTADEALEAIRGYTAYFGTYSVDAAASIITHHRVCSLTLGPRNDLVRRYRFIDDDHVNLLPIESDNVLTWERLA